MAFINRAKQLGCSLDEITDLVGIWDGERCGPVQLRFHELVTGKIVEAEHQIAELTAFTAQLQTAATQLSGQPIDGPCGEGCACVAEDMVASATVPVTLGVKPDDPPIVCTLDGGAMPDRLVEWRAVLDQARSRTACRDGALRVEFDGEIALSDLTLLVAAEQRCCAFFAFAITVDSRGIALEVRAPDAATDIVTSLFGQPA